jgi:hypothetical protein
MFSPTQRRMAIVSGVTEWSPLVEGKIIYRKSKAVSRYIYFLTAIQHYYGCIRQYRCRDRFSVFVHSLTMYLLTVYVFFIVNHIISHWS